MLQPDPSTIVERLKDGGELSGSEQAFIKERLKNAGPADDVYDLVRALALGAPPNKENVKLVERYFDPSTDDWDIQGVIYALCHYWGRTALYVDKLLWYAREENWDNYSAAAIGAFSALGEHLEETQDARVYRELLSLVDSHLEAGRTSTNEQHLGLAYVAIRRGVVGRRESIRRYPIVYEGRKEIEPEILREARRRGASQMKKRKSQLT